MRRIYESNVMCLTTTSDTAALTAAINQFSAKYHEDFFRVRTEASAYLSNSPSHLSAHRLAMLAAEALESWGAGKRGAPGCQSVSTAANGLCDSRLHGALNRLANSFPYLDIADGARRLKAGAPIETVGEFDKCLIETLNMLAAVLMVGNTNVTYPMKALLLITGLMPAYDSQVKGGLAVAGVSGINKTHYLLPRQHSTDAKKICVLPFYIASCVTRSMPLLDKAIENSAYPMLKGHYGRLFDVLLFVQRNRTAETALVRFLSPPPARRWYEL